MIAAVALAVLWLIAQSAGAPLQLGRPALGPQDLRQQGGEPEIVLQLEQRWAGADALMPLTTSQDPAVRHYALRAVGRLQDPTLVPRLLSEADARDAPLADIANAIARSFQGFDPQTNPALIAQAADWMYKQADMSVPAQAAPYLMPMSRIAYTTSEQVHRVEKLLVHVLDETSNMTGRPMPDVYAGAADAIERLGRTNAKTARFDEPTVRLLASMVAAAHANDSAGVRFAALGALVAGGAIDQDTERAALKDSDDDVRRIALTVAAGSGGGLSADERRSVVLESMHDSSPIVRYEALRAYVRRGGGAVDCQPILDRFDDGDSHVALAAIDAIGTACLDNVDATDRVSADVRTPPVQGAWNRPAHAFVALAKRAPDRAAPLMGAFANHPLWWVRLYAVRAAAAMKDALRLEKLALDANDNVREAALAPLRQLGDAEADTAIAAALDRSDYQLLRTAANLLKRSPADARFATPLVAALLRVTAEHKDTSRDARLALLDAIAVHGSATAGTAILPLAKDFDPRVAASAASIASRLTGRTVTSDPLVQPRGWPRQFRNLRQCVQVHLASGPGFLMQMLPEGAPIAVDRFLTLATVNHYYDGLAFHRVEPNFVVQGGSPNANEYSGANDFMRDEIAVSNARGTVGLSTRGLNTGDAQFYVNLVDNRRLDDDYTVFARVIGMDAVEQIEQGEQIVRIDLTPCPPPT
ncbi:MAG: peptidylprolyl isomerase [Vicinamibacterales bacterium]